jgi:transcriptional regulator of heat shock response
LPTDKAYDWFVQENLINRPSQKEELDHWQKKLVDLKNSSFSETAKRIAALCDSLTIGYLPWEQLIYKYGFKNLFARLVEINLNEWKTIWEDIDQLDDRLEKIANHLMEEELQIFLGEDSPLTRDRNLSVISSVIPYNRRKTLLILIGPKNMICEKNLNILEAARNILNQINNQQYGRTK